MEARVRRNYRPFTLRTFGGSNSWVRHRRFGASDSRLQSRPPNSQRDWRNRFAGQSSIRDHVVLRCGLHLDLRIGYSRSFGYGTPLQVDCVPNWLHGGSGCGDRSLCFSASASQRLRPFRIDWIPSPARFRAHVETRSASENFCRAVLHPVCPHMVRNRFKLKFRCRASLGLREARPRHCPKSSFRRLVRLVCTSGAFCCSSASGRVPSVETYIMCFPSS